MKTKKAILRLGRDKWHRIIAEQKASGSSVSAYCRQRQVNEKTFYTWRKKIGTPQESKPERFIQITAAESDLKKVLQIQTPKGYRLEVEAGTDQSYVQSILKILAGLV